MKVCQDLPNNTYTTSYNNTYISSPVLSLCSRCPGGRSCSKCLTGFYDEIPDLRRQPPVLVPLAYDVEEKIAALKKRRRNRFYMRCVLGIEIALAFGYVVRVFTLTESDIALSRGLSFAQAVHKFFIKMAYDYGKPIARYVITHQPPGRIRKDRHVICYGTKKLDVLELDKHWHKVFGSKVTGMEKVWSPRGLSFYLAHYLQADGEKFVKATMSPGWVFPKWWQFNLGYHRAYGVYPSVETFVNLLKLPGNLLKGEVEDYLRIWGADSKEILTWKKSAL